MVVVLAVLGVLLYTRMESALDDAVERNLRARADAVAALMRQGEGEIPEDLSESGQTFAQVLDRSGAVVDSTAELNEPLVSRVDVARAAEGAYSVDRPMPGSDDLARILVTPFDPGSRGTFLRGPQLFVVVGESLEPKGD